MSQKWTLGSPMVRKTISEQCEVTDGSHEARARYRRNVQSDQSGTWIGDNGEPLDWQPTHWRPASAEIPADSFTFD